MGGRGTSVLANKKKMGDLLKQSVCSRISLSTDTHQHAAQEREGASKRNWSQGEEGTKKG